MRKWALLLFICLLTGCATTPRDNPSALNGRWIPNRQEIAGKPLPASVFKDSSLTLSDGAYTSVAESVDKGIFTCDGGKMDIYGKEGVNAGKHFTAIFHLDGDQLTICYNLDGDAYPESFATVGKPKFFLSVFKKN